jgi:4-amino-4-deoxychorismate lyase
MSLAYLNGQYVDAASAALPAGDHGVLYGLGFFETFRTAGGRVRRWPSHRARLEAACSHAGIAFSKTRLASHESALDEAVARLLAAHGWSDAAFRYTVTAGKLAGGISAASYQEPGELLTARPLPSAPPDAGVELRLLRTPRQPPEWTPRPKCIQYANALLGWRELLARGGSEQDEGLFLASEQGFVVEATRHNVFWIAEGEVRFPDTALGPVAGTALAWVLAQGRPARAVRAVWADLLQAEAIALCNAVRGITPVLRLRDTADRVAQEFPQAHRHPWILEWRRCWDTELSAAT